MNLTEQMKDAVKRLDREFRCNSCTANNAAPADPKRSGLGENSITLDLLRGALVLAAGFVAEIGSTILIVSGFNNSFFSPYQDFAVVAGTVLTVAGFWTGIATILKMAKKKS